MKLYTHQFKAMGSACEIKLYIPKGSQASLVINRLKHEVYRYEKKYTRYKKDSTTSTINTAAGTNTFISIDNETSRLLDYAQALYDQSDGMFDITSGILRQAWDFTANSLPTEEKRHSLLPLIGWDKVERKNNAVRLPLKGMEIDFGGYVKEYTADACATLCAEMNIHHGVINLGGDVRIIGPHPNGDRWKVGIQHPRHANIPIATIEIVKGAITTSGDYERYMIIDDKRYCHILNPKTGMSISPYYAAVSVIAEFCLIAGSFSTIALMKSASEPEWIKNSGLPWLGVTQEMEVVGTLEK